MNPNEQRVNELQAQIATAQAEIAQIKATDAMTKAEGMHEMPDGTMMKDSDMADSGSDTLMNRNTAAAIAAYEADNVEETDEIFPVADRGLEGERDADGNFSSLPTIKISGPNSDIDVDNKTDAESKKMRRTSNKDVTFFEANPDMERDGGRASAESVEPSERTMGMTQDEGGTSSVDEKDDFWKTEEGYNKAIEMYGSAPAWVKEPTMIFNPTTQKYEKIKQEDKEQYQDMGISDANKRLFG